MKKIFCFLGFHDLDYQKPQGASLWEVGLYCKRCSAMKLVDWSKAANIALLETQLKVLEAVNKGK